MSDPGAAVEGDDLESCKADDFDEWMEEFNASSREDLGDYDSDTEWKPSDVQVIKTIDPGCKRDDHIEVCTQEEANDFDGCESINKEKIDMLHLQYGASLQSLSTFAESDFCTPQLEVLKQIIDMILGSASEIFTKITPEPNASGDNAEKFIVAPMGRRICLETLSSGTLTSTLTWFANFASALLDCRNFVFGSCDVSSPHLTTMLGLQRSSVLDVVNSFDTQIREWERDVIGLICGDDSSIFHVPAPTNDSSFALGSGPGLLDPNVIHTPNTRQPKSAYRQLKGSPNRTILSLHVFCKKWELSILSLRDWVAAERAVLRHSPSLLGDGAQAKIVDVTISDNAHINLTINDLHRTVLNYALISFPFKDPQSHPSRQSPHADPTTHGHSTGATSTQTAYNLRSVPTSRDGESMEWKKWIGGATEDAEVREEVRQLLEKPQNNLDIALPLDRVHSNIFPMFAQHLLQDMLDAFLGHAVDAIVHHTGKLGARLRSAGRGAATSQSSPSASRVRPAINTSASRRDHVLSHFLDPAELRLLPLFLRRCVDDMLGARKDVLLINKMKLNPSVALSVEKMLSHDSTGGEAMHGGALTTLEDVKGLAKQSVVAHRTFLSASMFGLTTHDTSDSATARSPSTTSPSTSPSPSPSPSASLTSYISPLTLELALVLGREPMPDKGRPVTALTKRDVAPSAAAVAVMISQSAHSLIVGSTDTLKPLEVHLGTPASPSQPHSLQIFVRASDARALFHHASRPTPALPKDPSSSSSLLLASSSSSSSFTPPALFNSSPDSPHSSNMPHAITLGGGSSSSSSNSSNNNNDNTAVPSSERSIPCRGGPTRGRGGRAPKGTFPAMVQVACVFPASVAPLSLITRPVSLALSRTRAAACRILLHHHALLQHVRLLVDISCIGSQDIFEPIRETFVQEEAHAAPLGGSFVWGWRSTASEDIAETPYRGRSPTPAPSIPRRTRSDRAWSAFVWTLSQDIDARIDQRLERDAASRHAQTLARGGGGGGGGGGAHARGEIAFVRILLGPKVPGALAPRPAQPLTPPPVGSATKATSLLGDANSSMLSMNSFVSALTQDDEGDTEAAGGRGGARGGGGGGIWSRSNVATPAAAAAAGGGGGAQGTKPIADEETNLGIFSLVGSVCIDVEAKWPVKEVLSSEAVSCYSNFCQLMLQLSVARWAAEAVWRQSMRGRQHRRIIDTDSEPSSPLNSFHSFPITGSTTSMPSVPTTGPTSHSAAVASDPEASSQQKHGQQSKPGLQQSKQRVSLSSSHASPKARKRGGAHTPLSRARSEASVGLAAVLHSLTALQSHYLTWVHGRAWPELEAAVHCARSIEDLVSAHSSFLDQVSVLIGILRGDVELLVETAFRCTVAVRDVLAWTNTNNEPAPGPEVMSLSSLGGSGGWGGPSVSEGAGVGPYLDQRRACAREAFGLFDQAAQALVGKVRAACNAPDFGASSRPHRGGPPRGVGSERDDRGRGVVSTMRHRGQVLMDMQQALEGIKVTPAPPVMMN